MDVKIGFLVLLLVAGSCVSNARNLVLLDEFLANEGHVDRKIDLCTLCEDYTTMALDYLADEKTQAEVIEALHNACSGMHSLKAQCVDLVDIYAPRLFSEVSSVQPEAFCKKAGFCKNPRVLSLPEKKDKCDICQLAMNDVLDKLKDPDTKLEVIEVLLKTCNVVEKYAKKCKTLVFEFGPIILVDAEKFIEKFDICTKFHACPNHKVNMEEALADGKITMVTSS